MFDIVKSDGDKWFCLFDRQRCQAEMVKWMGNIYS